MPFCKDCGAQIADEDEVCKECGGGVESASADAPADPPAPVGSGETSEPQVAASPTPLSGAWIGGQVATLVGSVMLIVGPFMAWVTAGFLSASGMQKTGNEAIILVALGITGAIVALVSLVMKRSVVRITPLLTGVIGLALSIYYLVALLDDLADLQNEFFSPSLGAGIYICLVASALVLVGSLFSGSKRRQAKL